MATGGGFAQEYADRVRSAQEARGFSGGGGSAGGVQEASFLARMADQRRQQLLPVLNLFEQQALDAGQAAWQRHATFGSTIAGLGPAPAGGVGAALQQGVSGFLGGMTLANEYAPDRILVNTICLGLVKSAQWERRAKGDLEGYYREVAKRVPVGRVGEAEEFADLAAFLCSARAGYITGTAINFDGGMSAAF